MSEVKRIVLQGEARGVPWRVTKDEHGFTGWCEEGVVSPPHPHVEEAQIVAMKVALQTRTRMDEEAAVRYSISIALHDSGQPYDSFHGQDFGRFKDRAEAKEALDWVIAKLKERGVANDE